MPNEAERKKKTGGIKNKHRCGTSTQLSDASSCRMHFNSDFHPTRRAAEKNPRLPAAKSAGRRAVHVDDGCVSRVHKSAIVTGSLFQTCDTSLPPSKQELNTISLGVGAFQLVELDLPLVQTGASPTAIMKRSA